MQDAAPVFDERGQVAIDVQLMYGFVKVYSAKWNEFTPSAAGTKTVTTSLGEGYTATVADDGRILVNGEEIYLNYRQGWFNPGTFSVPATTDVVTVSNDGKTLTYKGEYVDNNIICLGDVQKSAINNLNIIMNSNMMQRRYGVEVKDYSTALGNLKAYQSVTKDSVQKASANVESLNKVIAMLEDLNASDYTKASWAAVEEALNAAKAVAAKADATVIETTNAMTDLPAAMNSLEQGVEKTHLEISIKEAEKVLVRADKYSSLGNLEEAVANGKAVLANEEVIDGKSERGGYPVIRKPMRQWVLKITEYAERLLADLDDLDWPEATKQMQRNWIGKSIGANVDFKIDGTNKVFTVFTTRCDTLFLSLIHI